MFRSLSLCAAALLTFVASPATAQSPFDGTWQGELASAVVDAKPDQFEVKNGVYSCSSCLPPFSVKADGAFHPVKDKPYWDEISVTVIDETTVGFQYRKAGKVVGFANLMVSADGATLSTRTRNTNNAVGTAIGSVTPQPRVGPAPAGAHPISGSWKPQAATSASDAGITLTIKVAGDTINISSPLGETIVAKFGGDYVLNVGDPGKTMTKAELLAPDSFRLTDMRVGKMVQVSTYTVGDDGATLNAAWTNPRDGSRGTFVLRKR